MDWAVRSARSGSVAATASAIWRARWPSGVVGDGLGGAFRVGDKPAARSGSVAACAFAMLASAMAFR